MFNAKLSTQKIIEGIKICALTLSILFLFNGLTIAQDGDKNSNNEVLLLEANFIGKNFIYLTDEGEPKVKNDLIFYIRSVRNSFAGKSEPIPAIPKESYIKLFFEYGEELGDLASVEDASSFSLSRLRDYDNKFDIIKNDRGSKPSWTLEAKSKFFLHGGSNNRIELQFSDISSHLLPGLTTMHIEYGKIPGYKDGHLSLPIIKEKPKAVKVKYGLYVGDTDADPGSNNLQVDGEIQLQHGGSVNEFSVDSSMSGNSDRKLPTEKAVKTYVDNRLPPGVIVMWSGDVDKVPEGWALCDGNNGTPDLRNVFILGYGKRALHETGGQESVVLTVDQMPEHSHTGNTNFSFNEPTFVTEKIYHAWNSNRKYANGVQSVAKTSTVNLDPSGKGQAHDNMPPFYVLAYIMKLPDSSVSQ
jgi:microcystin-dependent protein